MTETGARSAPPAAAAAPTWAQIAYLPPQKTGSTTRAMLLRLGVAAVVVAFLVRVGHYEVACCVAVIATTITAVHIKSANGRAYIDRGTAWLAHQIGRILTFVVLVPVYLLVFVPVAIFGMVTGSDRLALRFDGESPSYWRRIARPASASVLYARTFAYERDVATARRTTVFGTALKVYGIVTGIIVANFIAGSWLKWPTFSDGPMNWTDPKAAHIEALEGADWLAAYKAEFYKNSAFDGGEGRFVFHPTLLFRMKDTKGSVINVENGIRRSYEPAQASAKPVTVGFYGGSTIWGWYQRDLHTIPSEFARVAEAHNLPIRVINYGLQAYVTTQEAALFAQHCARGTAPDIAIFYDGWNDMAAELSSPVELGPDEPRVFDTDGHHEDFENRLDPAAAYEKRSAYDMFLRKIEGFPDIGLPVLKSPEVAAKQALGWYVANHEHVHRVGGTYGVRVFSFMQPWYRTKKHDPREDSVDHVMLGGHFADELLKVDRVLRAALPPEVNDLGNGLDEATGPVFVDGVHHNELGSAVLASRIFEAVRPSLESAMQEGRSHSGSP